MSGMKSMKVVKRSVAIALGIVCIILIAGLLGAVADYTSMISDKDNTIIFRNIQISSLQNQASSLQNQVDDLSNIVNLNKSRIWVLNQTIIFPAGSYASFIRQDTDYAGYVSFIFQTPMSNTTYVQAIYSSNGINYDYQVYVGTNGTASLPVLPTPSIYIRIGDPLNAMNVTMTITYTY
jgi:hypothetical protein